VQRFSGLPWEKNPNITDVIWSGWPFIEPKVDGSVITALTPARGMSGSIAAALYTENDYGSTGAYAIQAQLGGNSSYFKCDALASYISGTGKAWSSFFAGSIPRTTNAGLWLLFVLVHGLFRLHFSRRRRHGPRGRSDPAIGPTHARTRIQDKTWA
jgi:hypothetical protein